jgi:hypothetical protein
MTSRGKRRRAGPRGATKAAIDLLRPADIAYINNGTTATTHTFANLPTDGRTVTTKGAVSLASSAFVG